MRVGPGGLLVVVISVTAFNACEDQPVQAAVPSEGERPRFAKAKVYVTTAKGEVEVDVEVARNDAERTYGLMFTKSLPETSGMIFLFPTTEQHSFWMKNTPLSLDMIFLDENRKVVGIYEQAVPLSTARMGVGAASRYVLEVNGGWARRHGVTKGATVRFSGVER